MIVVNNLVHIVKIRNINKNNFNNLFLPFILFIIDLFMNSFKFFFNFLYLLFFN